MTTPPASHPLRSTLLWVLKITVSVGLLYFLLRRVDVARLWAAARGASLIWLAVALVTYLATVLVSAWRWRLLLTAQRITVAYGTLVSSFLVATFFNNFLPSNIGGDVIRIADTARAAGSKTLATTVVLLDRAMGLVGLVFVAALGASVAARLTKVGGPVQPALLWAAFGGAVMVGAPFVLAPDHVGWLLGPLRRFHQEWVEERINRLTAALARFKAAPQALLGCFCGAIVIQVLSVGFYAAIAHSVHMPISSVHLAILIPLSFVVQMLPLSVNGFGVREGMFVYYFTRLGLPSESALLLSFLGAALIMLFSVSGGVAYLTRPRTT